MGKLRGGNNEDLNVERKDMRLGLEDGMEKKG